MTTEALHPTPPFDAGIANPARMYDFWLGGKDNYAIDREAAGHITALAPAVPWAVRQHRDFLTRTVRYLASETGIAQFLELGSGFPCAPNIHETARAVTPDTRVVYVDNDPSINAHTVALRLGDPGVAAVHADIRDTTHVLDNAARTLDFDRPVAVLLAGILHHIPDADNPTTIAQALSDRLVPGSALVISHMSADSTPDDLIDTVASVHQHTSYPAVFRTTAEITALFGGLPLIKPGLVAPAEWNPDHPNTVQHGKTLGFLAGVGMIPTVGTAGGREVRSVVKASRLRNPSQKAPCHDPYPRTPPPP
jgi:S-adenosyl methyltransferase